MLRRFASTGVAAILAAFGASTAQADTIILGTSGWQATWDSSLDGLVDIIVDGVTADSVIIQKAAEFRQPPGPDGLFPPILVTFQQISPNAVSRIIMNDEILTNSTGAPWTDFHMELVDGGDATFDPAATYGSGFSIAPFTNLTFSPDNTALDIFGGGSIPNGGVYFPGAAAGNLFIDVVTSPTAPFTTFTLKEYPTPEPTTALLLVLGAALIRRR
jgi:hypothetical protein